MNKAVIAASNIRVLKWFILAPWPPSLQNVGDERAIFNRPGGTPALLCRAAGLSVAEPAGPRARPGRRVGGAWRPEGRGADPLRRLGEEGHSLGFLKRRRRLENRHPELVSGSSSPPPGR